MTHQNIVPGRIGQIIPTLRQEVIPGDSFQGRIGILVRFRGFAAPVLTPTYLDYYMFYVPNRLVWNTKLGDSDSWEDFITGQTIEAEQDNPESPSHIQATTTPPTAVHNDAFLSNMQLTGTSENSLYSRGYNLIWNNYFRDEDYAEEAITNTSYKYAFALRNQYNELRDDTASFQEYAPLTDLSGTDYVGAQDVRDAMRRQRFAERREMFGDRYIDVLQDRWPRRGRR